MNKEAAEKELEYLKLALIDWEKPFKLHANFIHRVFFPWLKLDRDDLDKVNNHTSDGMCNYFRRKHNITFTGVGDRFRYMFLEAENTFRGYFWLGQGYQEHGRLNRVLALKRAIAAIERDLKISNKNQINKNQTNESI